MEDDLDFSATLDWITRNLPANRTVGESMRALVDYCSSLFPSDEWVPMRALPFDELRPLENWLRQTFEQSPPSVSLQGLWFGLFYPNRAFKSMACTTVADMAVVGSDEFSEEDEDDEDDFEWASEPVWSPERSAESEVLAELYQLAYGPSIEDYDEWGPLLGNNAEYPIGLGYAAFSIRHLFKTMPAPFFLDAVRSKELGIAVGFNDGDGIVLGSLTRKGFHDRKRN